MKQNQKPCTKTKKVISRGKRSKALSEINPIENVSKNLRTFLYISSMEKKILSSHKLQVHAYEYWNSFGLKEGNHPQRNCQNQFSHPGLSCIEQECQEHVIQGKILNQQNSNKGLKYP